MNSSLMDVQVDVHVIVPQALVQLGTSFLDFLLKSVVASRIPANITIQTAKDAAAVAMVPEVVRDEWKRHLAATPDRLMDLRLELAAAERDEEGRLQKAFWAWPVGTPVVEVSQWLKEHDEQ